MDLHKIRRNWQRAAATLPVRSPDRLAAVPAPLDAYAAGAELLERLRRELRDTFPEQQRALGPFVERVERCFGALRQQTAPDTSPQREQLMAALRDLEDICEAFLGLGR